MAKGLVTEIGETSGRVPFSGLPLRASAWQHLRMAIPVSIYALEQPIEYNGRDYHQHLDEFVVEVIHQVEQEMRRQPAHMVYELINMRLAGRLPGIGVDQEALRDVAARIAIGLPVA
jgi:hypothetical protein